MDAERPITRLLQEWQAGDAQALDRLIALVYPELRSLASRHLSREKRHHTLQPTALVNEAYLRLAGHEVQWESRAHFFGVAAQVMRRILVDHARRARRDKRGGGVAHVALGVADVPAAGRAVEAINAYALDRALTRLEAFDPQQGRIVELRYFGGMTIEETAQVMRVSTATVKRDWAVARAWLFRELSASDPAG